MPEYNDEGFVLHVAKHAENGAVVTIFSKNHGLVKSYCRGAFSKKNRGVVQTGNLVSFRRTARLDEQLGTLTCELITSFASIVMTDLDALSLMNCVCSLMIMFPQGEAVQEFYDKTLHLVQSLTDKEKRYENYARWELSFLSEIGFGLDLSACAVTGQKKDLIYVSPKTGRAVCKNAGKNWADKLLPLPSFLLNEKQTLVDMAEIRSSLTLTGFFLEKFACPYINCIFPVARKRLIERMAQP